MRSTLHRMPTIRVVLIGMMVVGLAECNSGAAKTVVVIPPEQDLASGTRVRATIQDVLSSQSNVKGDTLHAIVSGNVNGPHGGVVIPAGSSAKLTVALLEPGNDQTNPNGQFALVVSSVTVNGEEYPVTADLEPVPHHLEIRATAASNAKGGGGARRDVIVSAGTPIVFALTNSLMVSAR
jgi:hypothetical protein